MQVQVGTAARRANAESSGGCIEMTTPSRATSLIGEASAVSDLGPGFPPPAVLPRPGPHRADRRDTQRPCREAQKPDCSGQALGRQY